MVTVITIVSDALQKSPNGLIKRQEDLEIRGQEDSTIKIGQNNEKSSGDLTQTSVEDHQLTLM